MSDGHFNRSLLPKTDFQSGVKAGRATANHRAKQALETVLATCFPTCSEEQKETARRLFQTEINT